RTWDRGTPFEQMGPLRQLKPKHTRGYPPRAGWGERRTGGRGRGRRAGENAQDRLRPRAGRGPGRGRGEKRICSSSRRSRRESPPPPSKALAAAWRPPLRR
ncbi:unnamed protein product, partial [Prorocentrum cordatum]